MATVTSSFGPPGGIVSQLYDGMIERGLPPHVAEGFLMNMQDESGFNPTIEERVPNVHGTRGIGLYQATGPRRTALEGFAASRGVGLGDVPMNLDFLMSELSGPESAARDRILATNSPGEAAAAIARYFLRPAKQHLDERTARYLRNDGFNSSGAVASSGATGGQQMNAEDFLNSFDNSLMNISTRGQAPQGLLGIFGGDQSNDPLALSPRYHVARAMGNIGDRLISLGRGTPLPEELGGDKIMDRVRSKQSRNHTAAVLEGQGHSDLANMVLTGQMSGADAMKMIYQEKRFEQEMQMKMAQAASDNSGYGKTVQYATDEDGNQRPYVVRNGQPVYLDLGEGMQATPPGMTTIETDTGTWLVDKFGNKIKFLGDNFSEGKQREARLNLNKAIETFNSRRGQVEDLYNHPGLEGATGVIQGNIEFSDPAWKQMNLSDDAREFIAKHNRLIGGIFLDAFEQLKGGGQITVIEGEKATQAKTEMERATSPETYRRALIQYVDTMRGIIERLEREAQGKDPVLDQSPFIWDDTTENTGGDTGGAVTNTIPKFGQ